MQTSKKLLVEKAKEILQKNSENGFIMPDQKYYEGAWLWDTGFIEIGEAYFDPEKAGIRLVNFITQAQWKNGFLPHILFFTENPKKYFPGPAYWQTRRSKNCPRVFTSGITQPPNLSYCALIIYQKLKEKSDKKAKQFLDKIYPCLLQYHHYLWTERDPERSGLVSIYHPWESGMDNSPRWEEALSKIAINSEQINEIHSLRKDVRNLTASLVKEKNLNEMNAQKLASSMRPSDLDYARYFYLLKFIAERNYDDKKIYPEIPFNIKDVLFNSIFYVSNQALLSLAEEIEDFEAESGEIKNYLKKQSQSFEKLYDEKTNLYYDFDVKAQKLIKRKTIASLTPLFASIPKKDQAEKMIVTAFSQDFKGKNPLFLIPSCARSDPSFCENMYWRGPIWIPNNWLIAKGCEKLGLKEESVKIKKSLLQLVQEKGFWEYYHPDTNLGLGRGDFSWSAALILELLSDSNF